MTAGTAGPTKVVVFGPGRRVGLLVGDMVVDAQRAVSGELRRRGVAGAAERAAALAPADLLSFVTAGSVALDEARSAAARAVERGDEQVCRPAASVQLHAPWPGRRIACAGGNFADHLAGMWPTPAGGRPDVEDVRRRAREEGQWGFWKVPADVPGPGADVPVPRRTQRFDYEAEVAIVIGRAGKDLAVEEVAGHIWGVTLVNDWSIRDEPRGPARPMSYNTAKNFDGSLSLGPCVVAGLDPTGLDVETSVNGRRRQSFSTADMIFSFGEIVSFLSRDFTFVPGDVIAGGTGAGTGADTSPPGPDGTRAADEFVRPGDVVSISSPQVGTLSNRLVQCGGPASPAPARV